MGEFMPVCALSVILLISSYAFDVERRRTFLMEHFFLKQAQDDQEKREMLKNLNNPQLMESPKTTVPEAEVDAEAEEQGAVAEAKAEVEAEAEVEGEEQQQ